LEVEDGRDSGRRQNQQIFNSNPKPITRKVNICAGQKYSGLRNQYSLVRSALTRSGFPGN
jgi:hypothetical protein